MKTIPALLLAALCAAAAFAQVESKREAEVSVGMAKTLALAVAEERLAEPRVAGVRLYRDLEDQPTVWVFEIRSDTSDTPLTVVAAARRDLPPVVMHWRGLPWHADPAFQAAARASLAEYRRPDAKADFEDLRWEGPFDLWVPRRDSTDTETFAGVRARTELTRQEVAAAAAGRPPRLAPDAAESVRAAWAVVDRAGQLRSQERGRPVAATPRSGFTRYIPRVPYLYQGQSPDCGVVSMMDILLYHDANGFPSLVNEADLSALRLRLRTLMQWTSSGTYAHMQLQGTRSYITERSVNGFTLSMHARSNFRDVTSTNMNFSVYTAEIDAGRPVQLNVTNYGGTTGGHAICGVGYYSGTVGGIVSATWAIVHDNWKGSFTDPYQNPDEPYVDFATTQSLIKVIPPAVPATPINASSIVVDSPTNGSTVAMGVPTNFSVRMLTPTGVTGGAVSFRAGSTVLRTTNTPDANQPAGRAGIAYSVAWTPTTAGSVTLTASGTDSLNRPVSATVTVVVPATNSAPTAGWASPQYDNTQILTNNPVTLSVSASDPDGTVAAVEFFRIAGTATSLGRVTPSTDTFVSLRNVVFPAAGDFTLRAIVTDNRGATTSIDRRVRVVAGATANNDAFANATVVPAAGTTVTTTTASASREAGEPQHAGDSGGRSLWWRWTPGAGTAVITTRGSTFDTLLGVYTGSGLGALTTVASSDDDSDGFTSEVRFTATAGTTYHVAVDGYGGDYGDISLAFLHASGPPANDAFSGRTPITTSSATIQANSSVATRETNEPRHANAGGGRSLWWTWTAPSDGTLNLSTAGSTFDTLLGVYTGASVGALTTIAADDDSGAEYTSVVSTPVVRGVAYHIAVDGYASASGAVRLVLQHIAAGTRANNDAFASRAQLTGNTPSVTTSSAGATKEAGEPNHAGSVGGASLWWTWTAPADGSVVLTTAGSNFDTVMAVYTGAAFNALSAVAADDDGGEGVTSRVTMAVRSGVAYQIAVDGYDRATGTVVLNLVFTPGGTPAPGPAPVARPRLGNVATRGLAGTGSSTMIAGFNIAGNSPKAVLIRAVGPALRGFGVGNALADPVLSLFRGDERIAANDNWEDNTTRIQIVEKSAQTGAFSLPAAAKDAVILTTLAPGGYTAQVAAAAGTSASGVVLVEVYDADTTADADATGRRLINLSTRGQVGTGGDILIAGIVISGTTNKRVLIRGIGPTLGAFGVAGALSDPVMTVLRGTTVVDRNDDWGTIQANRDAIIAATQSVGGFALSASSRDAVLLLELAPGGYTVQIEGFNGATGVGLIEAYELP